MLTDTDIGTKVKTARERAGITQERLAQHMCARGAHITSTAMAKLEKGNRALKFSEAIALCDALSITTDELWGGDPLPVTPPTIDGQEFLEGVNASIRALQVLASRRSK